MATLNPQLVTSGFDLPGHRIVRNLGITRGIVVRSRSIVGAREDAFRLLMEHAAEAGANAIIAMRYDANDVAPGVTEVLAYGTAVVVEPGQ